MPSCDGGLARRCAIVSVRRLSCAPTTGDSCRMSLVLAGSLTVPGVICVKVADAADSRAADAASDTAVAPVRVDEPARVAVPILVTASCDVSAVGDRNGAARLRINSLGCAAAAAETAGEGLGVVMVDALAVASLAASTELK